MNIWYEFYPSDTLFFRGAEPLDSGVNYKTELLFPPPPSVIAGAIRTAVLSQKSIGIREYREGHDIKTQIGEYGTPPPFAVIGPILKEKRQNYYVPAPFTFYKETSNDAPVWKMVKIKCLEPIESEVKASLGIGASSDITHWTRHAGKLEPLGGKWISLDALASGRTELDTCTEILIHPDSRKRFFAPEKRTGITLDRNRAVEQGQIYSASHIRLARDVSLVWGIDADCGLAPEGLLVLGGEQRFGRYVLKDKSPGFPEKGDRFLALGPVPVTEKAKQCLVATGRIIYLGGWDYTKKFHKPMKPYYPAGTVFMEKTDKNCIRF